MKKHDEMVLAYGTRAHLNNPVLRVRAALSAAVEVDFAPGKVRVVYTK
jgi:hypothetical protein